MYKNTDWKNLIFMLFFTFLFLITGCQGMTVAIGNNPHPEPPPPAKKDNGPPPWAPAHGHRAKYKYRYYPNSRVYYEEGNKVYFYYKEGDWHVSASLPVEIRINFNEFVTLEMNNSKPYEYDHEVVKRYPPGQMKKKGKKKDKDKWD